MQDEMAGWCADGRLRPFASHRFEIDDFQEAMATVLDRNSRGKVAIVFPGVGD